MDSNRPQGFLRRMSGLVQDVFGDAAGDAATEVRGKAKQAAGQVQDTYGEVLDEVEHFVTGRPFLALLAGVGVGFLLGVFVARR